MNILLSDLSHSCLVTGKSGIALRSRFPAVGKTRRWIGAGIGLVASRSFANPLSGAKTLRLLRSRAEPQPILEKLLSQDPGAVIRHVTILDPHGHTAVHTGSRCVSAAVHTSGADGCARATTTTWDTAWQVLVHAFENTEDEFAARLLAAGEATELEGGDQRGKQVRTLIVVSSPSSGVAEQERLVDLRVDDHPDPAGARQRLRADASVRQRASEAIDKALTNDLPGTLADLEPLLALSERACIPLPSGAASVRAGASRRGMPGRAAGTHRPFLMERAPLCFVDARTRPGAREVLGPLVTSLSRGTSGHSASQLMRRGRPTCQHIHPKEDPMSTIPTFLGPLYVDAAGSGPPVVMWPSLFCDGTSLRRQADELVSDHRVLVVDPPGHGRTPAPPARFSLEDTAVALGELMDACHAPRAIIVGNAWGGMVATQLAITQPERIVALVLMNCPFHEWAGIDRLKLRMTHWLLVTLGPRRMASTIFATMVAPETRAAAPDRYREVQRAMRGAERIGFARCAASAMFDRPQLRPSLSSVRAPTLVLAGDRDPLCPVAEARAEAALIPGARFAIIEGTAHLSGWEAPEPVNVLIRSFVEGLPTPGRAPQARR